MLQGIRMDTEENKAIPENGQPEKPDDKLRSTRTAHPAASADTTVKMEHADELRSEMGRRHKTLVPPNSKTVVMEARDQPTRRIARVLGPEGEIPREIPVRLGRYIIDGLIGRGGMGVVYKARQDGLSRVVAVKLLLNAEHATTEDKRRFEREAKAIAKLRHPNIVSVHEVGDYNGQPFFTMDYIDGLPLSKFVEKAPIESQEEMAELCIKIANAIDYAHEQGVIHRDIKPENILMTASGEPIVTDFGLAKDMDSMSVLSMSGEVIGTPAFMSPEQASGRITETDRRSDVYALGAMLYWLLTDHAPFEGQSMVETLSLVANEDPPPATKINPSVHGDLCAICLKAMEKEKDKRYDTAGEFADDLKRFIKGYPVRAKPWSWHRSARRFVVRHKWAVISAAVALVAIAAAGILSATVFARTYIEIAGKRLVSPDPVIRAGALNDLGREALKPEELKPADLPKALALLAGMCSDKDDRVITAWLEFLAEHGDVPGVADAVGPIPSKRLVELAESNNPAQRNLAITAIGRIRRPDFCDYLIQRLHEQNPAIRMLVIRSLAEQKSSNALGPLINIVSSDSICRAEAKAALDKLYKDGRVTFFDSQDQTAKAALHNLGNAMDTYNTQMEEALDDISGEKRPTSPFAESEKALASQDPQARIKAVYELGLTGDKRAASLLMPVLSDSNQDVGAAAAMAISRVDPEGQLDTLRKNLSADLPALRGNSALALGFAKKKDDLDLLLVALAKEKDLEAKKQIIRGLSELGLAAAIPGIQDAAKNDPCVKPDVDVAVIMLK